MLPTGNIVSVLVICSHIVLTKLMPYGNQQSIISGTGGVLVH